MTAPPYAPPPGTIAAEGAGWVLLVCDTCAIGTRVHRVDASAGKPVRTETARRVADFALEHNGHALRLVGFES